MGLDIFLEDENGQRLRSLDESFDYDEIENIDIGIYKLFKYVDFYGDTVFNRMQMDDLIDDLYKLKEVSAQKDIINKLILLAKECQNNVHTYVKFYGD